MKAGKRKVYWDSTCWLAWLNGEGLEKWPIEIVEGIQDVVNEVEAGDTILFTSTLTRTEVPLERLDESKRNQFSRLLRRRNVTQIDPTPKIMDRARKISAYHLNKNPSRTVHLPDAIHLATAIIYEADEFQTMDGLQKGGSKRRKLLALSGDVDGYNLKVVAPYRRNEPPSELVTVEGPLFPKENGSEEKNDEQQTINTVTAEIRGSSGNTVEGEARAASAEASKIKKPQPQSEKPKATSKDG